MISLMITGQLYDIAFNYTSTKLTNLLQIQELPDLHPRRSHKAGLTLCLLFIGYLICLYVYWIQMVSQDRHSPFNIYIY